MNKLRALHGATLRGMLLLENTAQSLTIPINVQSRLMKSNLLYYKFQISCFLTCDEVFLTPHEEFSPVHFLRRSAVGTLESTFQFGKWVSTALLRRKCTGENSSWGVGNSSSYVKKQLIWNLQYCQHVRGCQRCTFELVSKDHFQSDQPNFLFNALLHSLSSALRLAVQQVEVASTSLQLS